MRQATITSHVIAAAAGAALVLWFKRRAKLPPWLRGEYVALRPSALPACPFELLAAWMAAAEASMGFLEAHAMVVATSTAEAGATARTVVLQDASPNEALLFGSSRASLKGRQVEADGRAEAVLRFGQRQVRVRGRLRLDEARAAHSFARVMPSARQGLRLLRQGAPIGEDGWASLQQRLLMMTQAAPAADDGDRTATAPPPGYVAFVLEPLSFEFYNGGEPHYFNDRFLYVRDRTDGAAFAPPTRLQA